MTSCSERHKNVALINEAISSGARKSAACRELGISIRTLQRWTLGDVIAEDQRPSANRPDPANKLTDTERQQIMG